MMINGAASLICKAIGQLACLCGVLYALEQVFGIAEEVKELDDNVVGKAMGMRNRQVDI